MKFSEFEDHFFETIEVALAPLIDTAWDIWEPPDPEPNILEDIFISFRILGDVICGADGEFHKAEIDVLERLQSLFVDQEQFTRESLRFQLVEMRKRNSWKDSERIALSKPYPLLILEIYDSRNGTAFSDAMRHLYFEFALVMASADGSIQPKESKILSRLKENLYENTSTESSEWPTPSFNDVDEPSQPASLENIKIQQQSKNIEDCISELNKLIGLIPVKKEVTNLVNLIKINNIRKEKGLPTLDASNHLVFYGNPGTGKTTVARLAADIYRSLGVLSKGHLVEVGRSDLVAGYLGQTAMKVKDVVNSAIGGVLFIDEAYTLSQDKDDYGKEAIDALLKLMEDYRNDLVVIVAGYPRRMAGFLEANPGLKSRFNRFLDFPDYSVTELYQVFDGMVKSAGLLLSERAADKAISIFEKQLAAKDEMFGNGRFVRNMFQNTISMQANRLIALTEINEKILRILHEEDITSASPAIQDDGFQNPQEFSGRRN